MSAPAWLTAAPVAHRGLHDAAAGRIENSLGAAKAAIARGFSIECDIQLTRDGEAAVFHDASLDRLTAASGAVGARSMAELSAVALRGSDETIPSLTELLTLIGGRVALVCEIKSHFDGDMRLAERAAALVAHYEGPLAFKSFDPSTIAHLRAARCPRPLGIVAEARYDDPYFDEMTMPDKEACEAFLHFERTRPDFLSWRVQDLPHATPHLLRTLVGMPVLAWTVRTPEQKRAARAHADQIVFEGEPA